MNGPFREVSAGEFFSTVGGLDVRPRPSADVTVWETRERRVVGKSYPGYRTRAEDGSEIRKRYYLAETR